MENTFYLEIITPDRQFYTGPATNLTMPALDGEYGVQPGHEPVVTALRPGTVRFQTDGTPTVITRVLTGSDRQFYTGPATNLTMPALDGEYGVQPGHEPVVTALRPGTVRFQTDGTPHEVVVSDGFAEIMPDYCILLVSSAERPDEIDRARAERAKERAEERLRQKQSIREYHLSKAALARAMARLKATR